MDTGNVQTVINLNKLNLNDGGNDGLAEAPSIADNVLYLTTENGLLLMFNISGCCDVNHQPKLLYQDVVNTDPQANNSPVGINRAPAIVNGQIFVVYGDFGAAGSLGEIAIYQLKK
jgi:hypothetical protein